LYSIAHTDKILGLLQQLKFIMRRKLNLFQYEFYFILYEFFAAESYYGKGKGLPQQAEVAQGFPGRLRPRIFLTFGTTRVVGRHPYVPAAFTPGEIPGTHF